MNAGSTAHIPSQGAALTPRPISGTDIAAALVTGWHTFRAVPVASMALAALFALMGSVLAFIILAISAFSVLLLHERRAGLVAAVHASVRAVFANFLICIAWGLVLTGATLLSILLLPLLTVVLPVLAYASFALYRKVFPAASEEHP